MSLGMAALESRLVPYIECTLSRLGYPRGLDDMGLSVAFCRDNVEFLISKSARAIKSHVLLDLSPRLFGGYSGPRSNLRELPDMVSAKFLDLLTASSLSAFGSDSYYKIHATMFAFLRPPCGHHIWKPL